MAKVTRSRSSSGALALYEVVVSCRVRGTCATDFWHVSIIDSSLNATSHEGSLPHAFIPLPEPKFFFVTFDRDAQPRLLLAP